jgi:hypothetical protein
MNQNQPMPLDDLQRAIADLQTKHGIAVTRVDVSWLNASTMASPRPQLAIAKVHIEADV